MKKVEEVLKQTGWSAATSAASAAGAPAAEEPSEDACPDCGGAGFVRRTGRPGPPGLGQGVPPPRPGRGAERGAGRLPRLQRYSNLGALLRLTFDDLMPRGRSPRPQDQERFARAVEDARQFAGEPSGWLVFRGPPGCGKTPPAAANAHPAIARGPPGRVLGR